MAMTTLVEYNTVHLRRPNPLYSVTESLLMLQTSRQRKVKHPMLDQVWR
jgi:hypothetical protein